MQNKKKILFILPSLGAGGAERVMSFVCGSLNQKKYDVNLVVLGYEKDSVFEVDNIAVTYLNKSRLLFATPLLFLLIIKQKPSIVVSSIVHVNVMMGCFSFLFPKVKFIGREASVVSKMNEFSTFNSKIKSILIKVFYPKLTFVICQTEDIKNDFINSYKIKPSKLVIINNPITQLPKKIFSNSINTDNVNFVTVGRLCEVKGYLRIINTLAKIKNYYFHYTIIGSGPQEEQIRQLIEKLGLIDRVSFISHTFNVLEEVNKNDYFIQGSYVEGFPNALLESCTVGTPVIAFDVPGGTKDIVVNGNNGFLINNESELYFLLKDLDRLKSIDRNKVRLSVIDKFNSEKIINQFEQLFSI